MTGTLGRVVGGGSGGERGGMDQTRPPRPQPIQVSWVGSPWSLVGLSIINLLLTMITIGLYSFWGRTEVRRRIWSSIRLQGEPLAYTGTGGELCKGFFLALVIVFVPVSIYAIVLIVLFGAESVETRVGTALIYPVFFVLFGMAIYRARRYRLSRTNWRGIRAGLTGSAASFSWLWIWTSLLVLPTLGWIVPWRANKLQSRLTREATFGLTSFGYSESARSLYGPFALLWIGTILLATTASGLASLVLGPMISEVAGSGRPPRLSGDQIAKLAAILLAALLIFSLLRAWYTSRTLNVFARGTTYDGARLRMTTTSWGLIGLAVSNFLIVISSLGILRPVVQARTAKYLVDRLTVEGTVDVDGILQSAAAIGRGGEGLAQVFDVDAL